MSNPDEMRRKLESLEQELNPPQPPQPTVRPQGQPFQSLLQSFDRLPMVFKVGAIAVALVLGLSIVGMVLKIVTSVIVVAVLAMGGYFIYKLLLEKDAP